MKTTRRARAQKGAAKSAQKSRARKGCRKLRPKQIRSKEMRENFSKAKTFVQNMQDMDIEKAFGEKFPESVNEEATHKPKLNEDEARITKSLHEKFGENYARMAKDQKINVMQWTKAKCEKYVKGFCIEKTLEQRSLDAENLSGRGIDLIKPLSEKQRKRNVFGH